jgi:hypothetical protein
VSEVTHMMLNDYERVIFYLLKKLDKEVDEINVVMNHGSEMQEFKIKKPHNYEQLPVVHKIEYITEI